MFIWRILELCLVATIGLIILTQVVIPPFVGKPFFWFFRKPSRELKKVQDDLWERRAENEILEWKNRLKKVEKEKEKLYREMSDQKETSDGKDV